MARLKPKETTIKKLFALSGNQCAYPECEQKVVDEYGTVVGQICHIEAAEQGGERYNSQSNDEERRSFDNLILLCANHHIKTNNITEYSVEKLKNMKSNHERKHQENLFHVSDEIINQAIGKVMEQKNNNTGSGTQFNNQGSTVNIQTQVGSQIINNNYSGPNTLLSDSIEGARKVNQTLKALIDKNLKPASQPEKTVIDYKNELQDKHPRDIQTIDTSFLKFRKENGRIKADVESYESINNTIIDEYSKEGQELLKAFLIKNDPEKNDELKKSLIQKGQREPAIITCDGFLINGNRRKMALEELFKEKDQQSQFQMMRVVVLEEGATELDIQKLENRLQLQSEGKSEYQGLNRALTIRANQLKGFSLEAQLRDDPNYHDLSLKEFNKVVNDYKKRFLLPLASVDDYLETFNKKGMYNTVSEGSNDKEGRWQAFVDFSNFKSSTLENNNKLTLFGIKESEKGKIEDAVFKIIRKRNLNIRGTDLGKLHDFIRKLPKYLKNPDAKKHILEICNVDDDIPEHLKVNQDGVRLTDREIDEKWGADNRDVILGNLVQANRYVNNQQDRDKPLELLEDALKKLQHDNLNIEMMGTEYYEKALTLTQNIIDKASEINKKIDDARFKLKKLKKRK